MFLALDLPEEGRERLARWLELVLEGRRDLRPVGTDALHVTLVFLGWQDESAAERIAEAAFAALPAGPAPRLTPTGVRAVPPRNTRLFALDLEDEGGRASALQASAARALEAGGWYRPEQRPFWPHVTLARVKRGERRVPPLPDTPAPPAEPFEASVVTLYRSTLRPQGSLYEPLGRTVAGDALDTASEPAAD
ncbi:MAG: 2,3-cyclic 3-phosphodiesterase [Thermoleophilaceae bacterium]|jgi:2'-5' RNA ligase|nr:2,3-cyclic 3-phosphodiesterase [Thermoleophilaceae bacterium]